MHCRLRQSTQLLIFSFVFICFYHSFVCLYLSTDVYATPKWKSWKLPPCSLRRNWTNVQKTQGRHRCITISFGQIDASWKDSDGQKFSQNRALCDPVRFARWTGQTFECIFKFSIVSQHFLHSGQVWRALLSTLGHYVWRNYKKRTESTKQNVRPSL